MRAIINATGYRAEMEPIVSYRPTPLLHVVDKPILFHIIEFLVQEGVTEFHFILSHFPQMIEDKVGDGTRWGINITYHLAKDPLYPFTAIRPFIEDWGNEIVLLGTGDCLPQLGTNILEKNFTDTTPILWIDSARQWLNWAIIPANQITGVPSDTREENFITRLKTNSRFIKTHKYLSTRTFADLKQTNLKLISHPSSDLLFPATVRMVEPLIWISRGASIHPTAKIIPPVFIGENSQIKEASQIGPDAVIENDCIIDNQSLIEDALICQHSYVGEALEISNSIVDRSLLINLSLGANITVHDEFIISEMTHISIKKTVYYTFEKICAFLSLIVLSPIYLIMMLTHRVTKESVLKLPASQDQEDWISCDLNQFTPKKNNSENVFQKKFKSLPKLLNILKGDLHFIGVDPKPISEVEKLPTDWRKLFLQSKNGLISLSYLDNGENPTPDDQYASEAYYTVHGTILYDLKLLFRWIFKK